MMDYRIEKKPELVFAGYKRRFSGTPAERSDQECDFYVNTRAEQHALAEMAHDSVTKYNIMSGFSDDGYDFYIAVTYCAEADLGNFERIVVPEGTYLICETERSRYPTMEHEDLRRRVVSEWLPSSGYELSDAPEISVVHWFYRDGDPEYNSSRYIELWLPIRKCE